MAKVNDVSSWLKPAAAARRLGVSSFRLRALAAAGELTAKRDFYGALRFDPRPLEAMRERVSTGQKQIERLNRGGRGAGDGKAHALAFRMFAAGDPPRDVVIATELTTTAVVDLRKQYAEMGRDFVLTAPQLEELRELIDWQGEPVPRGFFLALRARLRQQFERGQAVAAEGSKHTTEGDTSGNIDAGAAGQSRRSDEKSRAPLRRDVEDEKAD